MLEVFSYLLPESYLSPVRVKSEPSLNPARVLSESTRVQDRLFIQPDTGLFLSVHK